jgi:regulatory protein
VKDRRGAAGPTTARPVTAAYLERAALHYLERYGASSEMLRRVLVRKVKARCRLRAEDPEPHLALVEATVTRAQAGGLVNDAAFAAARAATLRRRGGSARRIAQALAAKGVEAEVVAEALAGDADAPPPEDAEAAAAFAYARRRRLGPYRAPDARAASRERDLAALARAGFAYGLARRVVEAEPAGDD